MNCRLLISFLCSFGYRDIVAVDFAVDKSDNDKEKCEPNSAASKEEDPLLERQDIQQWVHVAVSQVSVNLIQELYMQHKTHYPLWLKHISTQYQYARLMRVLSVMTVEAEAVQGGLRTSASRVRNTAGAK